MENKTLKGPVYLTEEVAQSILSAYQEDGNVLTFDVEHSTFDSLVKPEDKKAVGHFRLALRQDGFYAIDIQWISGWEEKIKNGEWVFFSPAIYHDEHRVIKKIRNVALTNLPAKQGIKPLLLSETQPEISQALLSKTKPIRALHQSLFDSLTLAQMLLSGVNALAKEVTVSVIAALPAYLNQLAEILEQLDPQGETMPNEKDEMFSAKNELFKFCQKLTGKQDFHEMKAVLLSIKSSVT